MVPRPPPPPPEPEPPDPHEGPYDAATNGSDAYGHPVNGYGRCAQLNSVPDNSTPPGCPNRAQRQAQMLAMPVDQVLDIAVSLGVAIPPLLSGNTLRAALVPLILLVEGYPA